MRLSSRKLGFAGRLLVAILVAIAGAFARRAMGGWPKAPGWIDITVLCGLALFCTYDHGWLTAGLVMVCTAIGWRLGHGSYMDMGYGPHLDNERTSPVVKFLVPERLWYTQTYDIVGMAVRYSIPAIPIGLLTSWWFCFTGLLVSIIYWVYWEIEYRLPRFRPAIDGPTAYAEFTVGAVFYGLLYFA